MSDDIVTRLREVAVQEYKDGWAVFPVCDQAADEIERLRKLTSELAQMMMPYALLMTKAEQEQVLKAVRNGF